LEEHDLKKIVKEYLEGDEQLADEIILYFKPIVEAIATNFAKARFMMHRRDDLCGEALLTLCMCVKRAPNVMIDYNIGPYIIGSIKLRFLTVMSLFSLIPINPHKRKEYHEIQIERIVEKDIAEEVCRFKLPDITNYERKILQKVVENWTYVEIAKELKTSKSTVARVIQSVREKCHESLNS